MLQPGGRGPGASRSGFSTLLESSRPRPLNPPRQIHHPLSDGLLEFVQSCCIAIYVLSDIEHRTQRAGVRQALVTVVQAVRSRSPMAAAAMRRLLTLIKTPDESYHLATVLESIARAAGPMQLN